tara:strand:+ start:944 stop:2086 length:1143 start_codon:yes stop_codon:yes gene_type:complete
MNKAFFINGGAGRVLCSMPGLERYAKTHDDFVIVSESWTELYMTNKTLRDHVYMGWQKDLFRDRLLDKNIISPEPYRLNAYFTQKANLIQAFDMLINDLEEVPETGKINIDLSKEEQIIGHNLVGEVKQYTGKDKVIVFQPFGQSVKNEGQFIYDTSGRSFEMTNTVEILTELSKNYGIIVMTQLDIPSWQEMGIGMPKDMNLNQWIGVINAADYFLGCDSVGQHMAHAMKKPATVVIGATFPENISYPDNKNFTIIDNGEGKRRYSPIRLTQDECADRNNEDIMVLEKDDVKKIVKGIKNKLGTGKSSGSKSKSSIPALKPAETASTPFTMGLDSKPKPFGNTSDTFGFGDMKPKKKSKPIDDLIELEKRTTGPQGQTK